MKFFQAYIKEMIDIGGNNLPKAISTKSGSKLGKLYKKRGLTLDIGTALKQVYSVLKAKPSVKKLNEDTYEVIVRYSKKFCPIGGAYNPSRATIFQKNICIPYTRGFLNELFPQFIFESDILNCIPLNNQRTCHYILNIKSKKNT
ncbi:MAG: hypothetical protein JSV23_03910 [Promethearchaeota archaeon]|nr:MAG: hypothetical protein JSV23_03910 [Candidatus Lokiarchaeota archaeon]